MLISLFLFLYLNISFAGVDLPWSTTFECGEWTQSDGRDRDNVNCDGMTGWGGWTASGGEEEQIALAANNPEGGGGKGQRHWVGDGENNNSGGLSVTFNSAQSEFWVRWYMRYANGFQWDPLSYDKILYIDPGTPRAFILEWYGADKCNIRTAIGNNNLSASGFGWNTTMGGSSSDGQWHCLELHVKMDTDGTDGIAEMWVDGRKTLSYSNVDYSTKPGWDRIGIGSNQYKPNNGSVKAVDFDDIAISATRYIGPIADK